jgi:hypothetical protein
MGPKTRVAVEEGRTVFTHCRRLPVLKKSGLSVLKPVKYNRKMGDGASVITKGYWRGMPMYNLTLEERATCPPDCPQWEDCYGNNMPFATRYEAGEALERAIAHDVGYLSERHPDGFVNRLHVLGDFYSVAYVQLWCNLIRAHPALRVFGFTHWQHNTSIGEAVSNGYGPRFRIMRSDPASSSEHDGDILPAAYTLPAGVGEARPGSTLCPWYSGKTASCLTCGLCWNGRISVSFPRH